MAAGTMNHHDHHRRWVETIRALAPEPSWGIDPLLIHSHVRPTFFRDMLTRVRGSDALDLGLSRLEWLPDLPDGLEWPQHEGKAMDFVAQINLSDLEAGFHPLLPELDGYTSSSGIFGIRELSLTVFVPFAVQSPQSLISFPLTSPSPTLPARQRSTPLSPRRR